MKTMTDRIRELADEKDLSNAKIADALDISEAAVSKWFKSGKVNKDHLPTLSRLLGRSIDYLMTGQESVNVEGARGLKVTPVPVISLSDAALFLRGELDKDALMELVPALNASGDAFSFRVEGDSMVNPSGSPSYLPGAICVCDPAVRAEPGRRVVVDIPRSGPTFKELYVDAGVSYLKPLNPRYPLIQMPEDSVILGVVTSQVSLEM